MTMRRKVHALINSDSGMLPSRHSVIRALYRHWEKPENFLTIQFSSDEQDGRDKARRAVDAGTDILLAAGGDGMINTIGAEIIGTDTVLGVIPSGSGNGFARHFGIPLDISAAAAALARAGTRSIDVGYANGRPFFVTCSLAWDAALVKVFEKSPMRGILPYIFAAVYEFFEYEPQAFQVSIDGAGAYTVEDPMLFTAANLTQYGAGARIAPGALADDGLLQLVTLRQKDLPWIVPVLGRVFDGTFDSLERIDTRPFRKLTVQRKKSGPMQLDGELVETGPDVEIHVRPRVLKVLVP